MCQKKVHEQQTALLPYRKEKNAKQQIFFFQVENCLVIHTPEPAA